ncbi:MAG TPA: 50S ribosomal protein L23 [Pseudomonadales bacterium]|nr:50S ribosomal protein L23 [Pseudomonadales bacterium]
MTTERHFTILLAPHFSEKVASLTDASNQYAFRVARDATKPEIKAAVESIFSVTVENVSTVNVRGKEKRTQRGISRKNHWKKAYVRLAAGQSIDVTATE